MAQAFWTAILAFSACFILTSLISFSTKQLKTKEELKGLVYSLTPRIQEEEHVKWYNHPVYML